MKLLFCPSCFDLFKLTNGTLRTCECGKVCGKYINNQEAVVNGRGVSIAIGNRTLLLRAADYAFTNFAAVTKEQAIEKFALKCWVRAHDGPTNPNTSVELTLGQEPP